MKLLFLVGTLAAPPQTPSDTTLLMRGLVVGTESWTAGLSHLEFHTRFEFVRKVDLSGDVKLEGREVRSLRVEGEGYPWNSGVSPFPVGLLARSSGGISCGSGCYVVEGSTVWVDGDGGLERAFVPTPFAPLVAVRKGKESEYASVLEAAAPAGLESVSSKAAAKALVIAGADVIDVRTGSTGKDATVVVRGGRIDAIGDSGLTIPEDGERLDAKGLTLLPGLWDMHAHLKQVEWLPPISPRG